MIDFVSVVLFVLKNRVLIEQSYIMVINQWGGGGGQEDRFVTYIKKSFEFRAEPVRLSKI